MRGSTDDAGGSIEEREGGFMPNLNGWGGVRNFGKAVKEMEVGFVEAGLIVGVIAYIVTEAAVVEGIDGAEIPEEGAMAPPTRPIGAAVVSILGEDVG